MVNVAFSYSFAFAIVHTRVLTFPSYCAAMLFSSENTVKELKVALVERGLPTTGRKADMLARLAEYLQSEAAKAVHSVC